jgi:hypothetical protein
MGAWVQKLPYFLVTGAIRPTLLALVGRIGDLTASIMKRDAGLKDFLVISSRRMAVFWIGVHSFVWAIPYSWLVRGYNISSPHSRKLLRSPAFPGALELLRFYRYSSRHTVTLPSSCFSTEAVEIRLGFTRLPGPDITSPPQAHPLTTSFLLSHHGFDASLRPLGPSSLPHHPPSLHTSTSPLAVSDGSVPFSRLLLPPNLSNASLFSCSGPEFGAFMDSYRAEAYVLFSLATLLDLKSKFFHPPFIPLQTIFQSYEP